MKVAPIIAKVEDGKVTFEIVGEVKDIPFSKVPGMDKNLKDMNLQRYFIRRPKNGSPSSRKKRFD